MPSVQGFNTFRARSYILRLPLFTRFIIVAIVFFWALGLQSVWDVRQWGSLIPDEITFATGKICPFRGNREMFSRFFARQTR